MQLFFFTPISEHLGRLEAEEARHCIKVLRHKVGDRLHAIDGRGNKFLTEIVEIKKDEVTLSILDVTTDWGEHTQTLELAISPLRHRDRLEWAVEKAVELGVTSIHPVLCKRTVKMGLKAQRLEAQIRSALKQSKRSRLPELYPLIPFSDYLDLTTAHQRLIPYCDSDVPLHSVLKRATSHTSLLIGPEGDFTEEEVDLAKEKSFVPVSLGENRLRTETAAIYALGVMKWIREESSDSQ